MNWDRIEGNWKQFKGKAKEQWRKLTDDHLDQVVGKRDQLSGKIQDLRHQQGRGRPASQRLGNPPALMPKVPSLLRSTLMKIITRKSLIALCALGFTSATLSLPVYAADQAERTEKAAKMDYKAVKKQAGADYKTAKAQCDALSGNEKDVCVQAAKSTRDKTIADAKANRKTKDARAEAGEDKRAADYKVAKEKCDALSGDAHDKCEASAKAKYKM